MVLIRVLHHLTDGRSRSVKHAIEKLEKYGIISEEISSHDECIYSIRFVEDFSLVPFVNMLSVIDDLTDKPEGQLDHTIPWERLLALHPEFSASQGKRDDLDRGTWKFNALDAIEMMLWDEGSMNILLEMVKDPDENQGMVINEDGSKSPSLLDFLANNIDKVENFKEFYRLSPVERVYFGLIYMQESLLHLLSISHPWAKRMEKATVARVALFQYIVNISRLVLIQWINFKLKKKIPGLVEYTRTPQLTFILKAYANILPDAVRKKFNIEKIEERQK